MADLRHTLRVVWLLERAAIRAQMQYRANFLTMVLLGFVYQGSGFVFLLVVMHNFDQVAGWTLGDIAFLYGLRMLAHALWLVPLNHLWMLDETVREGDMDRYLLRPLSPFVQFMAGRFQMNGLGDLGAAALVMGFGLTRVDINFGAPPAALLVAAVVGGALIEGSVQIVLASWAFRTLSTMSLRMFADTVFGVLGSYPLSIFTKFTQILLCVFPVAFVAYFPAAVLLGKGDELPVPPWLACLSLPVGILMVLAARVVWTRQLRHYQSCGH